MNTLTEENIDFIYQDVRVKGITLEGLLDEMVDHICCSIEPDIDNGISFKIAYNNLMDTIESSTFKNVQHQTLLSTNLKFQNMRKLMIVLGSLSALFLSAGSILKLFHIPPASLLLLLGTAIAVLGFLPLFFFSSFPFCSSLSFLAGFGLYIKILGFFGPKSRFEMILFNILFIFWLLQRGWFLFRRNRRHCYSSLSKVGFRVFFFNDMVGCWFFHITCLSA